MHTRNGKLGRLVMDALLQKMPAAELAVAVRTPSKASDLAALGAQVRLAGYDRRDTPASAYKVDNRVERRAGPMRLGLGLTVRFNSREGWRGVRCTPY